MRQRCSYCGVPNRWHWRSFINSNFAQDVFDLKINNHSSLLLDILLKIKTKQQQSQSQRLLYKPQNRNKSTTVTYVSIYYNKTLRVRKMFPFRRFVLLHHRNAHFRKASAIFISKLCIYLIYSNGLTLQVKTVVVDVQLVKNRPQTEETDSHRSHYNLSFFMVKSITLQMSQSASALQEQFSSHFFKSSHSLKFLNCFSSLLISSRSDNVAVCYPFCHMNTSCRSWGFPFMASSSSKVTIFSRGRGGAFLGALTVSGSMFAATGVSPAAMDRSNSLMLLGTKYSMRGSPPRGGRTAEIRIMAGSYAR